MILHAQLTGAGRAVALIHGLFGSNENLGSIARSLADDFQVINIDVRNHGKSAHSDEMDYTLLASDLAETFTALNIAPYAILGHSMGGKIAMEYALQHPNNVTKLIIADIAPVAYHARHTAIFAGLHHVALATLNSRAEADKQLAAHIQESGVRQFLLKSLDKTPTGFCWRFNLNVLAHHYPALIGALPSDGQFNGPTLFIKGGNSDYILPEHKRSIMQYFPQAHAKIIQGTGHWLHAEKPAAFNKLVRDFLLS